MMSEENARRLAERQERDRPKITEANVEEYREIHSPGSRAFARGAAANGVLMVPGDGYIARLSHERFHEWFGTECDDTCPHPRGVPSARAVRRPWWRRLLSR